MVKLNDEQQLYIIPCTSGGFTCLGYDVAFRKANDVAQWLSSHGQTIEPPDRHHIGTLEGYADYTRIMDAGAAYHQKTGYRCDADLHPELIGLEGKRVEVTKPDGGSRRFWVGKSTGWFPVHLEIERKNSRGGIALFRDEEFVVKPV